MMQSKTFTIPNISCEHCVRTIQNEVSELQGVTTVTATEATKEVSVTWDEATQSWDSIQALLEEVNYPPA